MSDTKQRLSVIGLGKLGSPMAACFAAKGFDVVGVDLNQEFVDAINEGRAPVFEPQLQSLQLADLFRDVEMPLVTVLAEMEWHGIAIDMPWFASLKERFARERQRVEQEMH